MIYPDPQYLAPVIAAFKACYTPAPLSASGLHGLWGGNIDVTYIGAISRRETNGSLAQSCLWDG